MITPEFVSLIFLLILCAVVSYLDIRYRMIDRPYFLYFCGIIGFVASAGYYGFSAVCFSLIPAVGIVVLITVLNVIWVRKGKSRIVGRGDQTVYLTFCAMCPIVCGIPSALILPAFAILFAIFAGYIPRVAKAHDSCRIPLRLYMSMAVICCILINVVALS